MYHFIVCIVYMCACVCRCYISYTYFVYNLFKLKKWELQKKSSNISWHNINEYLGIKVNNNFNKKKTYWSLSLLFIDIDKFTIWIFQFVFFMILTYGLGIYNF